MSKNWQRFFISARVVSSNQSTSASFEALLKSFDRFERKFEALAKKVHGISGPSKDSSRSQSKDRGKCARSSSRDSSGLCLAHRKYPK